HIPTDEDWATLVNNLGGYVVAGGKLKATSGWDPPNTGATNSSGFSSTSGGYRNTIGEFNLIGTTGYWWSSTEYNPNFAWISKLHSYIDKVTREYDDKEKGFSVRCLRD
ncbi:MAG: FISUMP domain-containing protein, partial [Bacteroidota bacterium]